MAQEIFFVGCMPGVTFYWRPARIYYQERWSWNADTDGPDIFYGLSSIKHIRRKTGTPANTYPDDGHVVTGNGIAAHWRIPYLESHKRFATVQ
jgi:hypothetical protein